MEKKKLLYYFYNRLNDPLLQSNIFLYINALALTGEYDVAVVTYEDSNFPLSPQQKKEMRAKLRSQGISWYPLTWHAGSNLFLKVVDLSTGFLTLKYLVSIKGYRHAVSLGSIAGSFLYLFSKLARVKFYLYQYEPHSEYALDNGLWSKESLQYRLLNRLEKRSVRACKVVSSGTDNMRRRLADWNISAGFFKVCSVANDRLFNFNPAKREEIRRQLGVTGSQKLIVYPGKLGELYCSPAQLTQTFKTLFERNDNYRFVVISPNAAEVKQALSKESDSFRKAVTLLPPVPYEHMPHYLSAADLGLVAVLPGPSKQFISNIKVGEYLCSGLPYLICRGISEDDRIAEANHVGVVVNDLTEAGVKSALNAIGELLAVPREEMAARCREAGILYRGFEGQFAQFKKAVELLTDHTTQAKPETSSKN